MIDSMAIVQALDWPTAPPPQKKKKKRSPKSPAVDLMSIRKGATETIFLLLGTPKITQLRFHADS